MYGPDDMDISETLHPCDVIVRELRRQADTGDIGERLDPCDRIVSEIRGQPDQTVNSGLDDIRDLIVGPSMPEAYETHPSWMAMRECDERRASAIDRLAQPAISEPEPLEDPYYPIRPESTPSPGPWFPQPEDWGLRPW
jgi:hypothetical protein